MLIAALALWALTATVSSKRGCTVPPARIAEAHRCFDGAEILRAVVDASPLAVVVLDVDRIVRAWNPAAETMFGWRRDDVIGRQYPLVPPESHDAYVERTNAAYDGAPVLRYEAVRQRKDGSRVEIEALVAPMRDDSGRVWALVALIADITERKREEVAKLERERLAGLLADVSLALTKGTPLDVTLDQCTRAIVCHLDAAFARVWTLNDETSVLELQASAGMYTHLDGAHSRVPLGALKIDRSRLPLPPPWQARPRASRRSSATRRQWRESNEAIATDGLAR